MQIISGLQNLDRDNVASVVTAADKVCIIIFNDCGSFMNNKKKRKKKDLFEYLLL